MDMTKNWNGLIYIKWISLILPTIYSVTPFINGLGCDFQQQYERDDISFYSTCKFGYVKTVGYNKISEKVIKYEGFIGKHGDTVIFIATKVDRQDVTKNPRHSNVYSVLNDDALYIAKFIQKDKDGWIVMTYPYYLIQKVKIVGTQSFW
jgi:hypothetical protein